MNNQAFICILFSSFISCLTLSLSVLMKSNVWANLFIKHYAHINITLFIALFDLGFIYNITPSSYSYVDISPSASPESNTIYMR